MNLVGPVGELRGAGAPPKNSTRSDFGEIWTIYVNLPKIKNRNDQNNVASHVRDLWGVTAPSPPPPSLQNSNISDFGEILDHLCKFALEKH